jgi:hypothetical protein
VSLLSVITTFALVSAAISFLISLFSFTSIGSLALSFLEKLTLADETSTYKPSAGIASPVVKILTGTVQIGLYLTPAKVVK